MSLLSCAGPVGYCETEQQALGSLGWMGEEARSAKVQVRTTQARC